MTEHIAAVSVHTIRMGVYWNGPDVLVRLISVRSGWVERGHDSSAQTNTPTINAQTGT